jgi:peptidoglycan hydrolase-like protein with peptidoglycan-binding domain
MAYTDSWTGGVFYNVDWTVGLAAFNNKDDVMLVQTLLNIANFGGGKLDGFELTWPPGETKGMTVDGICGPITLKWIKQFQRCLRTFVDGKMDPYYPPNSPKSKKLSAMFVLNNMAELGDSEWFYEISIDENTPLLLRNSLKRVDSDARQHTQAWPQPAPKTMDPMETWLRMGWTKY